MKTKKTNELLHFYTMVYFPSGCVTVSEVIHPKYSWNKM